MSQNQEVAIEERDFEISELYTESESNWKSSDEKTRIGTFLICILCVGAVYMAMLLFATPKGYTDCPSVGARYLLPVLLPLCIAMRGEKISVSGGVSDELFVWGQMYAR